MLGILEGLVVFCDRWTMFWYTDDEAAMLNIKLMNLKCEFSTWEATYLNHVIDAVGIHADS